MSAAAPMLPSTLKYVGALALMLLSLYALNTMRTSTEEVPKPPPTARGRRIVQPSPPPSASRPPQLTRSQRPTRPSSTSHPRPPPRRTSDPALADDCFHVYLDLGTNIGVQIHKLYHPKAFPGSPVRNVYNRYFGAEPEHRNRVCSFGWEPNPRWAPMHRSIERHYRDKGTNVTIYSAGAGVEDGWAQFVSDGDLEYKEWGGSVQPFEEKGDGGEGPAAAAAARPPGSVRIMNVVQWVIDNVAHRRIPPANVGDRAPAVVMKLDIEGSDEAVLDGLFKSGALCGIDFVYTEYHIKDEVVWDTNAKLSQAGCDSRILIMDDEEYLTWELGQELPYNKREWNTLHPLPKRDAGVKMRPWMQVADDDHAKPTPRPVVKRYVPGAGGAPGGAGGAKPPKR
jgi:hypothetical protein